MVEKFKSEDKVLDEESFGEVFSGPEDEEAIKNLEAKLKEYDARLEKYAEGEEDAGGESSDEVNQERQRDTEYKIAVLRELLESGEVNPDEVAEKLREETGDEFDAGSLQGALASIRNYAENGVSEDSEPELEVVESNLSEVRGTPRLYDKYFELSQGNLDGWNTFRSELEALDDDDFVEQAGSYLREKKMSFEGMSDEEKKEAIDEMRGRLKEVMDDMDRERRELEAEIKEAWDAEVVAAQALLDDIENRGAENVIDHIDGLPADQLRILAHFYMESVEGADYSRDPEGNKLSLEELRQRMIRLVERVVRSNEEPPEPPEPPEDGPEPEPEPEPPEGSEPIPFTIPPGVPEGPPENPENKKGKIWSKLGKIKVFGRRLPEFLAGAAAGGVVRRATKMSLKGVTGFVPAMIAGGIAGGTVAGIKGYMRESREYRKLLKDMEKESEEKPDIKALHAKIGEIDKQIEVAEKALKEAEDRAKEEKLEKKFRRANARKLERLQDQRRYALVAIRKQIESGKEPMDDIALLEMILETNSEDVVKEGDVGKERIESKRKAEVRKLKYEIMNSKKVDGKRLAKNVLKGALVGVVGGTLGALISDWIDGPDVNKAQAAGGEVPKEALVTPENTPDVSEVIPTEEYTPDVSEISDATSELEPPTEIIDAVQEINPDLSMFPDTINLPAGSNPWVEVEGYFESALGRELSNAEILKLDKILAAESGISVPEWGIMDGLDHKALPVGTPLNLGGGVKDELARMMVEEGVTG